MTYRLLVLSIATSLLGASPAAAQSREQRLIVADIRMLQEQTQRLELMLNTVTEAVHTVSQKLDQKLDDQANVNRKAFADLKLQSDTIAGDMRVMREKIDETNVRVGSMGSEIQAIQSSIQTLHVRPPSLTGDPAADPTAAPSPEAGAPASTRTAPIVPPGTSPTQTFERAQADYFVGQYSLAIQGFEAYLRWFPTLPGAADAQYYIGEAYRADGKPNEAIAAYDKVIANYPRSVQLAAARYKRGDVLQTQGKLDAAREEFERVVKEHPDASEARLAKQRLDGLLRPARQGPQK